MDSNQFAFASEQEKKAYVRRMFSEIAGRYDFFNHFLSLGFDFYWRRRAIAIARRELRNPSEPHVLDVACGTGDLSFELLRQVPRAHVTGSDLAGPMLDRFRSKLQKRGVVAKTELGDVERLGYPDESFDLVTIGFGTRNFTSLPVAFSEIFRVLRPGGVFINLELAKPRRFPMKSLYKVYFDYLLPFFATKLSKHDSAYRYLPDSLRRFPDLEALEACMRDAGFRDTKFETLTMGIVAVHSGVKPT